MNIKATFKSLTFGEKYLFPVALLLSMALSFVCNRVDIIDDAWITFRYSYNLTHKGQLVFNIGERVEGITNLLWAVLLAGETWVFSIPLEVAAILSSLLLIFLTSFRLWKIGLELGLQPIYATIPVIFILLTPDFWSAHTNGLEAPLFTYLIVEFLYQYLCKRFIVSAIALSLLFLTRPESVVAGFILLLLMIVSEPGVKYGNNHTKIWSMALYAGTILGSTFFRVLYYEDFIPNSVRAKIVRVSPWLLSRGVEYVMNFQWHNPHLSLIFMSYLAYLVFSIRNLGSTRNNFLTKRESFKLGIAVSLIILFSFGVAVRNGGDWMPHYRLLMYYGVLYSVLLILLISEKIISSVLAVSLIVMLFFQNVYSLKGAYLWQKPEYFVNTRADRLFWAEAVARLSPRLSPDDIISAEAIGFISYHLIDFYIHDPLGLTDRYIAAHGESADPYGKRDVDYTVWTVRPSIMIWHWAGHLRNLDPDAIDKDYRIYCYQSCDSWDADIVMIRSDRIGEFSSQFLDWEPITLRSLHQD